MAQAPLIETTRPESPSNATGDSPEERLARHLHERDRLFALGQEVAADRSLPRLFSLAASTALELVHATEILLFVPENDPRLAVERSGLLLRAESGDRRGDAALTQAAEELSRSALAGGEREPRAVEAGRSLQACTVLSGDRAVAVLVATRASGEDFDAEDRRILRAVGAHVAVALQSAQLVAERQTHVRELSLLNEIASACAEFGLDRLLPAITDRLVRSLDVGLAALLFTDQSRDEIFVGAAAMREGPLTGPRLHGPLRGMLQRSFHKRTGKRGTIADLVPDRLRRIAEERGLTHIAVSPLLVKNRAFGSILLARETRPFSDGEMRLLGAISSQVAVAVDNARLFSEVERRAGDLELVHSIGAHIARSLDPQRMLEALSKRLCEVLESDAVRVYARRGEQFVSIGVHGLETKESDVVRHLKQTDPVVLLATGATSPQALNPSDLPEPSRSFLAGVGLRRLAVAPLRTRQGSDGAGNEETECIGLLVVGRQAPRTFTPQELDVLGAVGAQVAVALRNGELFVETRRRAEDLAVMLEAGRMLTGDLALEDALDTVADRVGRLVGMRDCLILLLDEDGRQLHAAGASEHPRPFKPDIIIPMNEPSLSADAVRKRRVQSAPDAVNNPRVYSPILEWGARSAFSLPLIARDQVVGVIALMDDRFRRQLHDNEIDRVMALGNQVAIAIESARLQAKLQHSYVKLEATQAQLIHRERLAALGEIAALVAHEVRNPLGVVFNSLRSLARRVELEGEGRKLFDMITEELDRLDRIVGDLLDFARPPSPTVRPGALDRLIAESVHSATEVVRARGGDVDRLLTEQHVDPSLPPVPMDERLIRQALINVLTNALQSLVSLPARKGRVSVSVRPMEEDGRRVARVTVADDGPGIPADVLARIFEPFFTTKATGSGLGLAVVKRIVDGHGGEVRVTSTPGEGTTFILDLPLEEGARRTGHLA